MSYKWNPTVRSLLSLALSILHKAPVAGYSLSFLLLPSNSLPCDCTMIVSLFPQLRTLGLFVGFGDKLNDLILFRGRVKIKHNASDGSPWFLPVGHLFNGPASFIEDLSLSFWSTVKNNRLLQSSSEPVSDK